MSYYTQRVVFGQQNGFTLLELVIIIVLLGIIGLMVVPNWTGTALGVEFEARHVLDDIRYAQAISMATGQRYRFARLSSNTYGIYNEAGTAIVMPNGATVTTLTGNVVFSSLGNLPNNLIAFDSLGTPYITGSYPGTALASTATITLASGGNSHTISIRPGTGYASL